ncbi:twin-arginine translocation pathway signal protein [Leisingera sp. ANG1]|uniref:YHS domain-containing (seleno)protein n=1 Tax=unclassified Leisingera TaxID=2614906 RepID=UPI0002D64AF6|nr:MULTISPECIES: YHS domain-containing (seleno)protein [unclassified Leisingera]KIC25952.1 twin-arginine translocation pathway signal protein [Leisingera sp. ANG-S3]KID08230.1 twin-arginine translocation pathway signal protein [Leisingera sp. ANG1]KIC13769.1 twin-arginine translocation pathway signal protein [Leisingera sp. ANG-DT]KIC30323.1 twin-arginine translocation pathway signal protein [Leisingera sp. ANG-M6]KIC53320.1 twin-arginine translocation pathway signal protein [Leisingera sp. AN
MECNVILRLVLMAAAVLFLSMPDTVRAEPAVFSSRSGVAIGGYDAVAFFERGAAEQGRRSHAVMWKGVVWRFASSRNQALFEANPRAYAPAFGGYCAYAMSRGQLHEGNPQLWAIVDGDLYLLNNRRVLVLWQADTAQMIAAGHIHWPAILRK